MSGLTSSTNKAFVGQDLTLAWINKKNLNSTSSNFFAYDTKNKIGIAVMNGRESFGFQVLQGRMRGEVDILGSRDTAKMQALAPLFSVLCLAKDGEIEQLSEASFERRLEILRTNTGKPAKMTAQPSSP